MWWQMWFTCAESKMHLDVPFLLFAQILTKLHKYTVAMLNSDKTVYRMSKDV